MAKPTNFTVHFVIGDKRVSLEEAKKHLIKKFSNVSKKQ
jgi:hypothetical protein